MSINFARQLLRELKKASRKEVTKTRSGGWRVLTHFSQARTSGVWQRVKSEMRNGDGEVPVGKKEMLLKEYLYYVSNSAKHRVSH